MKIVFDKIAADSPDWVLLTNKRTLLMSATIRRPPFVLEPEDLRTTTILAPTRSALRSALSMILLT